MTHLRVVFAAAVALVVAAPLSWGGRSASADEGAAAETVQQLNQQVQQEQQRLDVLTADATRAQSVVARKNQEVRALATRELAVRGEMQQVARIEYQRPAI